MLPYDSYIGLDPGLSLHLIIPRTNSCSSHVPDVSLIPLMTSSVVGCLPFARALNHYSYVTLHLIVIGPGVCAFQWRTGGR